MSTTKTNGIVLRRTDYGEDNRMVTLLTPQAGLQHFAAYRCKKAAGNRLLATELFSTGEFLLTQKGERYTLSSFELIENYFALREDYEKLTHGVYWLNLCETTAQPGENCERLYKMLLLSLAVLNFHDLPLKPLTSVFLLQFSILQGYAPELDMCTLCGAAVSPPIRFHVDAGGVCCASCAVHEGLALKKAYSGVSAQGVPITMDDLAWLREAKAKGAFVLAGKRSLPNESPSSDISSIFQLLCQYVEYRTEKKIKSGRFL